MTTDADPENKKIDELKDFEPTQPAGRDFTPSERDFTPSERAFLDEVSAPWWEAKEEPSGKQCSPRARRRITH